MGRVSSEEEEDGENDDEVKHEEMSQFSRQNFFACVYDAAYTYI